VIRTNIDGAEVLSNLTIISILKAKLDARKASTGQLHAVGLYVTYGGVRRRRSTKFRVTAPNT
jgi:hypothetical protein